MKPCLQSTEPFFVQYPMQAALPAWLAPYVRPRSAYAYHAFSGFISGRFRHTQHNHASSTPFRPIAFYSLHPLPETSLPLLQSSIRTQLQKLNVFGRIYIASDKGIGGINAQLSVPVNQIASVQSFFNTLPEFKGVSFEYNHGMEDTERPSFRKLKVMQKPHVCTFLETCLSLLLRLTLVLIGSTAGSRRQCYDQVRSFKPSNISFSRTMASTARGL